MDAIQHDFPKLTGTQEVLLSENGDCLARVTAMGQAHLQGAHLTVEHAQSVSWSALGMALTYMGLAVLHGGDYITAGELLDLREEMETLIKDNIARATEKPQDDIPF